MPSKLVNVALFAACVVACVAATDGVVYAQRAGQPRGAASLERAHAAWNRGDFDTAETLFKEALDQGALPRESVLDANVFLGAARAVIGRKEPALIAFRYAALVDPKFTVPPEAGKKAVQLANVAKKQTSRIGQIVIRAELPNRVRSAQPFDVVVNIDPSHAAILTRVGLKVTDGLTPKGYSYEEAAAAQVKFTVPSSVTLPDANLTVRVVGLDGHDNEYVSAEGKVVVEGAPAAKAAPAPVIDVYATGGRGGRDAAKDKPAADKGSSKGFFATPWPYLIGGVVIAGAGASVYLLTRPGDSVSVPQTNVQAVR